MPTKQIQKGEIYTPYFPYVNRTCEIRTKCRNNQLFFYMKTKRVKKKKQMTAKKKEINYIFKIQIKCQNNQLFFFRLDYLHAT